MRAGGIWLFGDPYEDTTDNTPSWYKMEEKKMEKPHEIGTMNFWLHDTRDIEFNETTDCCYALYGYDDDEAMDIERYWYLCRSFAAAMGFAEETIDRWFGKL